MAYRAKKIQTTNPGLVSFFFCISRFKRIPASNFRGFRLKMYRKEKKTPKPGKYTTQTTGKELTRNKSKPRQGQRGIRKGINIVIGTKSTWISI